MSCFGFSDMPNNRVEDRLKGVAQITEKMLDNLLRDFKYESENRGDMRLPAMAKELRATVHRLATKHSMKTKSIGTEGDRYVVVQKKMSSKFSLTSSVAAEGTQFELTAKLVQRIGNYLKHSPLTDAEMQSVADGGALCAKGKGKQRRDENTLGRLARGRLTTPPAPPHVCSSPQVAASRAKLPVAARRRQLLDAIERNQVVLVSGGTGCGKTTQVPQYLLEEFAKRRAPCRIICTQPRRLPAVAVANRVAFERGEDVGGVVGYQIRLERKVSSHTVLTYCTSGVLMRSLTDGLADDLTHVILDEVHEREQHTDFLLTTLRVKLDAGAKFKLILMSATMKHDLNLFLDYFKGAVHVDIPSRLFDIETFHLTDILRRTKYERPTTGDYAVFGRKTLQTLHDEVGAVPTAAVAAVDCWQLPPPPQPIAGASAAAELDLSFGLDGASLTESDGAVDFAASDGAVYGGEDMLRRLEAAIAEQVGDDGSEPDAVLLSDDDDDDETDAPVLLGCRGAAAESVDEGHVAACSAAVFDPGSPGRDLLPRLTDEQIVEHYRATRRRDEEKADLDLIFALIHFVMDSSVDGAVLCFLPGYDDISELRRMMLSSESLQSCATAAVIYTLHSRMQSADQRQIFVRAPPGQRKVILSTNIAEASLTIDDVVFVIDSGLVKEKRYFSSNYISTLICVPISQSSAEQRSGRAGRCRDGFVFRLYSKDDYDSMPEVQTPELLRTAIHEVCIHTKLLASPGVKIEEFLSRAPEAPPIDSVRNAIDFLKLLGAMGDNEELTQLGRLIADLPLDPQLSKMLLVGAALQCLEPVLTIVAALSYRDPFVLPLGDERRTAELVRDQLGGVDLSDHLLFLRAFELYAETRANRPSSVYAFCRKLCLSQPDMQMIWGVRLQLRRELERLGFSRALDKQLNCHSRSWPMVQAAVAAGAYPGIGFLGDKKKLNKIRTATDNKAHMHTASVVRRNLQPRSFARAPDSAAAVGDKPRIKWLAFQELVQVEQGGVMIKTVTVVAPVCVALFTGPVELFDKGDASDNESPVVKNGFGDHSDEKMLILQDWLVLKLMPKVWKLVVGLRQKWQAYFIQRLRNPGAGFRAADQQLLNVLRDVLCDANEQDGLSVGALDGGGPQLADVFELAPQQRQYNGLARGGGAFHRSPRGFRGRQGSASTRSRGGGGGDWRAPPRPAASVSPSSLNPNAPVFVPRASPPLAAAAAEYEELWDETLPPRRAPPTFNRGFARGRPSPSASSRLDEGDWARLEHASPVSAYGPSHYQVPSMPQTQVRPPLYFRNLNIYRGQKRAITARRTSTNT